MWDHVNTIPSTCPSEQAHTCPGEQRVIERGAEGLCWYMCCKCSHQSFLPSECTFYQSLFLPWGWFIVDMFSSACSVIRTDGNRGQVCVVTSEWSYFDTCIVKKMFSDCYMFSEVIPNPFDWFFLCVPQKKAGEVAFFHIQWMSVGIKKWALVMSIWLPAF